MMRCKLGFHNWQHVTGTSLFLTSRREVCCVRCGRREEWTYYCGEVFGTKVLAARAAEKEETSE